MLVWTGGAKNRIFRQQRLLIVGAGQTAQQMLSGSQMLGTSHVRWRAVVRNDAHTKSWRELAVTPLKADLDQPASLQRLAGLADRVLHLAPPSTHRVDGELTDPRTRDLLRALLRRTPPSKVVYGSTSGVYGDCQGQVVTENRLPNPFHARAHRRVDAEQWVRAWALASGSAWTILRIPGIYGNQREEGGPAKRWLRGTPNFVPEEDVYINHIHMTDLACASWLALWGRASRRVVHVTDDDDIKMGDWWDRVAELLGKTKLLRVRRDQTDAIPLGLLSFMSESRRLSNERLKMELRYRLRYPSITEGINA
ncbi:MAG: hypothetical protein RLZZ397_669 [Pseudomonadota bacterium]|jgi:nucleoside-diphosphate-sugar epimerase